MGNKCTHCGEDAEYVKNINGSNVYYCYKCAKKLEGITYIFVKRCYHCDERIEPGFVTTKYDPESNDWLTYCCEDCAMQDLGYKLIGDEQKEANNG